MIVVISDIHLTDETTAKNVRASAFELLHREIIGTIRHKKDIREIRFVLLGDIVDLFRTDYWLSRKIAPEDRPWNGVIDPSTGMNKNRAAVELQFNEILNGIFKTNAGSAFFAMLNNVARSAGKHGVKSTKITYVVGNHDRPLNIFDSLRDAIRNRCRAIDALEFTSVFFDPEYSILARHGCEWDDICYSWKYSNRVFRTRYRRFDEAIGRIMSLGEVLTAELMSGIVYYVREALADNPGEKDKEFTETIKEVNNLRPMAEVFRYLDWLTKNSMNRYSDVLREALLKSTEATYTSSLVTLWKGYNNSITALLRKLYKYLEKGFGFVKAAMAFMHAMQELWSWIRRIFYGTDDGLSRGARHEWANAGFRDVQYVFYGHSHEARHDYFRGRQDGTVRLYINTGTFLPLIQECRDGKGYSTAYQMTMAYLYKGSEDRHGKKDNKPSLELWNGMKRKIYSSSNSTPVKRRISSNNPASVSKNRRDKRL